MLLCTLTQSPCTDFILSRWLNGNARHVLLSNASRKRNKSFTVTTPSQVPSLFTHTSVWVRVCRTTKNSSSAYYSTRPELITRQPSQIWPRRSAASQFCSRCAIRCAPRPGMFWNERAQGHQRHNALSVCWLASARTAIDNDRYPEY